VIHLDSDHLSALRFRTSPRAVRLSHRLEACGDDRIGTTIANVEESMRGWLATLAKEREVRRQIAAYRELAELFTFFSGYHIALFDDATADQFDALRKAKVRIGTMDLKTAAITLSNDALLLTANKKDFEQVPGLRFQNWMDP
jgi:tRNA(fMet)-specific endonuclease VapC